MTKEQVKKILEQNDIIVKKQYGQNFLLDDNILKNIVKSAELKKDTNVIEIGPGLGFLTNYLQQATTNVLCYEIDEQMVEHLNELNYNISIINDDFLKRNLNKDFKNIFDNSNNITLVANLPYYITTPIIMALLEKHLPITDIVVMVQKEVAERMAAQPGGKTYGALSVAVQYYTVPEIALYVPPRSFMPPPEVDSVVVNCKVRQTPAVELIDEKMFFRVVKAAFGQRRKTLNNALKSMGVDKNIIADVLDKAGIEATRRGETLTMEEFGAIANILVQMAKQEA